MTTVVWYLLTGSLGKATRSGPFLINPIKGQTKDKQLSSFATHNRDTIQMENEIFRFDDLSTYQIILLLALLCTRQIYRPKSREQHTGYNLNSLHRVHFSITKLERKSHF